MLGHTLFGSEENWYCKYAVKWFIVCMIGGETLLHVTAVHFRLMVSYQLIMSRINLLVMLSAIHEDLWNNTYMEESQTSKIMPTTRRSTFCLFFFFPPESAKNNRHLYNSSVVSSLGTCWTRSLVTVKRYVILMLVHYMKMGMGVLSQMHCNSFILNNDTISNLWSKKPILTLSGKSNVFLKK